MRHQKTPLSRTLPRAAERSALAEIERTGYALPCHVTAVSGQIVTVAFDCTASGTALPAATIPVIGAEYIRMPTQIGDKGYAAAASVDLSIVTGLGPGNSLPDLSQKPFNLSALVFVPIGNKNWTASPNANALVGYGPSGGGGVILQDKLVSPASSAEITASGISLAFGSTTITINSSGITLTCGSHSIVISSGSDITIDGQKFLTHYHNQTDGGTYVAPSGGGAVTGASGPVAGS